MSIRESLNIEAVVSSTSQRVSQFLARTNPLVPTIVLIGIGLWYIQQIEIRVRGAHAFVPTLFTKHL
jgi:hypothetical protein